FFLCLDASRLPLPAAGEGDPWLLLRGVNWNCLAILSGRHEHPEPSPRRPLPARLDLPARMRALQPSRGVSLRRLRGDVAAGEGRPLPRLLAAALRDALPAPACLRCPAVPLPLQRRGAEAGA